MLFNRLFDFGGVGHDHLHLLFDRKIDFVRARRIEGVGQRDLHGPVLLADGQALVHARDVRRNQLQQFGRKLNVAQGNHPGAEVIRHHLQDVVELHDPEILQQLEGGRAAAFEFGGDLFVLQIVNQPQLSDERQQWT